MEQELRYLTTEKENLSTYTKHFEDLATICLELINLEENKIKKYIEGLTPSIQVEITNAQPNTCHKAKELAFSPIKRTTYGRALIE